MTCDVGCMVKDDSDCADFIRATLADQKPDAADPVEAAYMQQEREAIQEEMLPDFARKFLRTSCR